MPPDHSSSTPREPRTASTKPVRLTTVVVSSVVVEREEVSAPRARHPGRDSTRAAKLGIVDLFAGIGGVAQGFAATGRFETIALVDIDPDARRTWEFNRSHVDYLASDVAQLKPRELLDTADGRTIAGIVGCPPCQGFSVAGRRKADDERNKLLKAFFDVVQAHTPRFFVMENVPSILGRAELHAQQQLLEGRYAIATGVMNGALYGLPQTRERAVMIGIDRELDLHPSLPVATHLGSRAVYSYSRAQLVVPRRRNLHETLGMSPQIGVPAHERRAIDELLPRRADLLRQLVRVWDAIGDLPVLDDARSVPVVAPSDYALSMGSGSHEVRNHARWGHTAETTARLATIAEGGQLQAKRTYYSQAYARLHHRGLARTVTTNFHNAGCGRFTHPAEPRTITVREAARLQGIPDDFVFVGSGELQKRLIGNAFPPPLAEAIASHLASQLDSAGALP